MVPQAPTTPPPSGVNESPRSSLSSERTSLSSDRNSQSDRNSLSSGEGPTSKNSLPPTAEELLKIQRSPKVSYRKSSSFNAPKVYASSPTVTQRKTLDMNQRANKTENEHQEISPTSTATPLENVVSEPVKKPCDLAGFFAALSGNIITKDQEDEEMSATKKKKNGRAKVRSNSENDKEDEESITTLPSLKVQFEDKTAFNKDGTVDHVRERAMKQHAIEKRRYEKEKAFANELEKLEKLRERNVFVDLEREAFLREELVRLDAAQDPMLKLFQQTLVKQPARARAVTLAVVSRSKGNKKTRKNSEASATETVTNGVIIKQIPPYNPNKNTGTTTSERHSATPEPCVTSTVPDEEVVTRVRASTWAPSAHEELLLSEEAEEVIARVTSNREKVKVKTKDDGNNTDSGEEDAAEMARILRLTKLDDGDVENDDADSEEDMAEMARIMKMTKKS